MELISTHICMTKDVGIFNNLFGGILCQWIDEAAAAYACMKCDTSRMVTLKIEELLFKRPIKQGQLVKIYGKVVKVGTTSITLEIFVHNYDTISGEEVMATSTRMVFVKIDDSGNACKIFKTK